MSVEVVYQRHPFDAARERTVLPDGLTVAGIVAQVSRAPHCSVAFVHDAGLSEVKPEYFATIRPKPGSRLVVMPRIGAAAIPLVGAALGGALGISATAGTVIVAGAVVAASYLAATYLFGSSADSGRRRADRLNPTIRGLQNLLPAPGAPVPMVLGRHRMAAVKTATGYSKLVGQKVYRYERMTFGVGPVELEDLKIGTTSITKFDDVEIQFRNVDETRTRANISGLSKLDCTFLNDEDTMTLYSRDVFEDADGARLDYNVMEVRTTPANTRRVTVQFYFAGLVKLTGDNKKKSRTRKIGIYYRPASGGSWVTVSEKNYTGKTTATLRFGESFKLPSTGEWDIGIKRLSPDDEDTQTRDDSYLEAVISEAPGTLPSPPGVAEIALRIKATEQISGVLDPVNAVVQQLGERWNGSSWVANKPLRHPADIYMHLLRGPMRKKPVADANIDIAGIYAWKQKWPDWRCDMVVTDDMTLKTLVDQVLATGLVSQTIVDGKYSLIEDKSDQPAVQVFTPRNTADMTVEWKSPPEVHALRARFTSEHLDWAPDEVIVYANGYNKNTATEIEEIDPPGFLVEEGNDITNISRWAYYHLAQMFNRTTTLKFRTSLEYLLCSRGDPVICTTDLLENELVSGRIVDLVRSGGAVTAIVLDNRLASLEGTKAHVMVRARTGEIQYVTATMISGAWIVEAGSGVSYSGTFDDSLFGVGDLATVYEYGTSASKWLVGEIAPDYGETATVTLVEATTIPLDDLDRPLPEYTPNTIGSAEPINVEAAIEYDDGQMYVALSWSVRDLSTVDLFRVSLADSGGNVVGSVETGARFASFPVQSAYADTLTASVTARSVIGAWSAEVTKTISTASQFDSPPAVTGFASRVSGDSIFLTWEKGAENTDHYVIRYSPDTAAATWDNAVPIVPVVRGETVTVPARNGTYLIKAVTVQGAASTDAASVIVTSVNAAMNVVSTLAFDPTWTGTMSSGVSLSGSDLVFTPPDSSTLSGSFEATDIVDLGVVDTARVTGEILAAGSMLSLDIFAVDDIFAVEDIFGGAAGLWSATIEISTTNDDPAASPVWSDWSRLVVGDYRARAFRFRLVFTVTDVQVEIRVSAMSVTVDMPDRIVKGANVTCPAGGVTITFSPPFRDTPTIVVDGQGLPSGAVSVRTAVSKSGFTQQFTDASGVGVACTFDYTAIGYGYEG